MLFVNYRSRHGDTMSQIEPNKQLQSKDKRGVQANQKNMQIHKFQKTVWNNLKDAEHLPPHYT